MNTYRKIYILLIYLTISFYSCSMPPGVYKLSSEESKIDYLMGREISTKENRDIIVSLNFEDQIQYDYSFFCLIKNNSNDSIVFSPENVFVEILNAKMRYISYELDTIYAVNPEAKIDNLKIDLHNSTVEHKTRTGINTIFGLVNVVSDIATSPKEIVADEVVEDIDYWTTKQMIENADYFEKSSKLNESKDFWQNDVLRKTTLYHEEKVGGLILIPIIPEAKYVRFHIALGENDFTFLYKQIKLTQ